MNQPAFIYSTLLERKSAQPLREWLATGADVNQGHEDSAGWGWGEYATLLHGAVGYRLIEQVEVLLEAGASSNIPDKRFGFTALHLACQKNDWPGLVQRLLDTGADATLAAANGDTPLDLAVKAHNAEAVEALIRHGVDTATAFRCYRIHEDGQCFVLKDDKVMDLLLAAGADININTADGGDVNTLLNMALDIGATESARFLLAHGANPNLGKQTSYIKEEEGPATYEVLPLQLAASTGCVKTIKALLKAGADVHAEAHGCTALSHAMTDGTMEGGNGNPRAVKALLDAGANPNADGAMIGVKPGRAGVDTLKALIAAGGDINAEVTYYKWENRKSVPLAIYAAMGNVSAVQVLLDAGADLVVNGTPIDVIIKGLDGRVGRFGSPAAAIAPIEARILRQVIEQVEQQAPVASRGRARL